MKPVSDLVNETGRVKELLPSFIRSLCRARFEYDPEELQEDQQDRIASSIESSSIFTKYQFPLKHAKALRQWPIADIKELIRRVVIRQQMRLSCPYLRDPKKRVCWSCPVARTVTMEMIGDVEKGEDNTE